MCGFWSNFEANWKSERRKQKKSKMNGNSQKPQDLKERTRDFALRIIRLYGVLPKKAEAQVIGKQVLRPGTSVGANYREGLRARSKSEYATKLNIGLMELEETLLLAGIARTIGDHLGAEARGTERRFPNRVPSSSRWSNRRGEVAESERRGRGNRPSFSDF